MCIRDKVDGVHTLQGAAGLGLVQLRPVHVAFFQGIGNVGVDLVLIFDAVHQVLNLSLIHI